MNVRKLSHSLSSLALQLLPSSAIGLVSFVELFTISVPGTGLARANVVYTFSEFNTLFIERSGTFRSRFTSCKNWYANSIGCCLTRGLKNQEIVSSRNCKWRVLNFSPGAFYCLRMHTSWRIDLILPVENNGMTSAVILYVLPLFKSHHETGWKWWNWGVSETTIFKPEFRALFSATLVQ